LFVRVQSTETLWAIDVKIVDEFPVYFLSFPLAKIAVYMTTYLYGLLPVSNGFSENKTTGNENDEPYITASSNLLNVAL